MSISNTALVTALREIVEFEEVAEQKLAWAARYDFSFFPPSAQKEITQLLDQLYEDSGEHESLVNRMMEKLNHDSISPRSQRDDSGRINPHP